MKTLQERTDLELLQLVCELHSRSLRVYSEEMHNASVDAKKEMQRRLNKYANQSKWVKVSDANMPKFYENYLLCINGTVQHITYQFVGKEVDEFWIMDESTPAYWFQAEYDGSLHQVLIDDSVFYQELPTPPQP